MKTSYLKLLAVLFVLCGCHKDEKIVKPEPEPDNITYTTIDQSLIKSGEFTINGCQKYIVKLEGKSASMAMKLPFITGDCGSAIIANPDNTQSVLLPQNYVISKDSKCKSIADIISLDDFKGKKNGYIGIRRGAFQISEQGSKDFVWFEWYSIYFSANGDTLQIIDRAINNTFENSIKAGQKN